MGERRNQRKEIREKKSEKRNQREEESRKKWKKYDEGILSLHLLFLLH